MMKMFENITKLVISAAITTYHFKVEEIPKTGLEEFINTLSRTFRIDIPAGDIINEIDSFRNDDWALSRYYNKTFTKFKKSLRQLKPSEKNTSKIIDAAILMSILVKTINTKTMVRVNDFGFVDMYLLDRYINKSRKVIREIVTDSILRRHSLYVIGISNSNPFSSEEMSSAIFLKLIGEERYEMLEELIDLDVLESIVGIERAAGEIAVPLTIILNMIVTRLLNNKDVVIAVSYDELRNVLTYNATLIAKILASYSYIPIIGRLK